MYIFSRTATLKPEHQLDGLAFAIEVSALAGAITGVPVNAYRASFGMPLGTILWSSRFESLAQLGEVEAKLISDERYLTLVDRVSTWFTAPATDGITNVVAATLAPPKPIVWGTQATVSNGKFTKAYEVGIAIQELVAKISGLPTAFCSDSYGPYGQVRWLTSADTMADLDRLNDAMTTDPQFLALLEAAGEVYVEGSGSSALLQKVN